MRNRFTALLLGLIMAVMAQPASAAPKLEDYMATSFWLEGRNVPLVMLVLERDWKMFYPAYNNLSDLDGDGALDIGFNPAVTYVGYFDSNSCYEYKRSGYSPSASNDEKGLFVRVGATTSQSQTEADSLAASRGIDGTNLVYPASKHGICTGGGNRGQGLGLWHGNWLNYALTSRMDAIRKVLYGGKRTTDTASSTILEMVRVPANANVWGGEIYADDLWEQYAPSSPWYDVTKFTGFNAPNTGTMHFWARGDYFWQTPVYSTTTPSPSTTSSEQQSVKKNTKPLFRFVANVPSTNRHPFLKVPLRIWDWAGDHASYNSIPSDGHLANSKGPTGSTNNSFMPGTKNVAWHFAARVEVCQPGNISETEGCQAYAYMDGSTAKTSYKPTGLLQEYGESERMFFGLLTGTISHPSPYGVNSGTRYKGGVVRHHIQNFKEYVNHVSYTKPGNITVKGDGSIVRPGLIDTIDAFEITGIGSSRAYADGSQAGNPLGEMVWEALRYLGGVGPTSNGDSGLSPTSAYGPTITEASLTSVNDTSFTLTKLNSWAKRPALDGSANECPKPVILAISEVFPDHDGDDYPNLADFKNVSRSSFAAGSGSLVPTGQFKIADYLDIITKTDKLSTATAGNKLFFYPDSRGLCSARQLNGLADIVGHCPSEPSLEGSYNLAAVAYYAHTHDFGSLAGKDGEPNNVDFYAVGIPGNFPDITLTLDSDHSMTLMPIALTAPLDASTTRTEGPVDAGFRTLLNFFIEYWQTDDGHNYDEGGVTKFRKVPYKIKFRTNFEFTLYPCFVYGGNSNNWERDLFNAVTITLLTDRSTDRKYRENEPLFINSGPFKTKNTALYRSQRASYRSNSSANPDNYFVEGENKYYYAFKRTKGIPLDISQLKVVGAAVHSDSTGSGYGASGQTGYTITGVTTPGAYLDVGLNRSDYPIYYSGTNCKPSKTVFVPNLACGDEDVPLDPSGSGLPGSQWNYAANGTHDTPSTFDSHRSGSTVYTNQADCGYYHPPTMYDELLTPAECPYAGFLTDRSKFDADPDLQAAYPGLANNTLRADEACGRWAAGFAGSGNSKTYPTATSDEGQLFKTSKMRYVQVRSFKFDSGANRPKELPNPMWLAAKYGGFKDSDGDGAPNLDTEWKRFGTGVGADDPYNYFRVANMSELPTQLGDAFETIANMVATGTATASSINTVLGGGLSIQTQYYPEYPEPGDKDTAGDPKVSWRGTVYAYFVDKWGNLRADSNGDKQLQVTTSPPDPAKTSDDKLKKEYQDAWDVMLGRKENQGKHQGEELGDLIVHTVIDSSNNPMVYLCRDMYGNNNDNNPLPAVPYEAYKDLYPPNADCKKLARGFNDAPQVWNAAAQLTKTGHAARRVYSYFGDDPKKSGDGNNSWEGGVDLTGFQFKNTPDTTLTALHRLMGQASEDVTKDLIDYIRGKEFEKYRSRTTVLPWDAAKGITTTSTWLLGDVINSKPLIVGDAISNYHLLYGAMSYADYKAGLSNGGAARRRQVAYFGANDGMLHAVNLGFFGALRTGLAGYRVEPYNKNLGYDGDIKEYDDYKNMPLGDLLWSYVPTAVLPHLQWLADPAYTHGFFVDLKPYALDITGKTNVLGEDGKWRTILLVGLRLGGKKIEVVSANPPITSYAEFFALDVTDPDIGPPKLLWRFSDPNLGLTTAAPALVRADDEWYAILPSGPAEYNGSSEQKARVFVVNARTGELAGTLIAEEDNSFFNDTFLPRATYVKPGSNKESWSHHVVYMGMTANNGGLDSGAVYRLQMAENGVPYNDVSRWKLGRMYKTDKPVTGAVNAAYDPLGNLWVVFGTGRVWSIKDLAPCGGLSVQNPDPTCCTNHDQYIFGLKEPLDADNNMTFAEIVDYDKVYDVSGMSVFSDGYVYDENDVQLFSYDSLYNSMITKNAASFRRGYKRKLEAWRSLGEAPPAPTQFEVVTTQVKIDGLANRRSNSVVTSYLTSANTCNPSGRSFLNVWDTYTGLPAPYMKTYGGFEPGRTISAGDAFQMTGIKKAGDGMASEAWILKAGGQTIYGNTSFNSNRNMIYVDPDQSERNAVVSWREVLNMGFDLLEDAKGLFKDIE